MRTVHIQPLTHEAFAPFGRFYPMEQPQGYALCGELHRFFTIVLPLVQPALITLTIFTFNGAWNNFLWPLIINTRSSMHVLTITMATLTSNQTTNYGMVMAGATLTFVFPFLLYVFLQKQFVEGVAMGGVKG